jgi:hypothetical protein
VWPIHDGVGTFSVDEKERKKAEKKKGKAFRFHFF